MIISVFIIAIRCDAAEPWIYINAQCTNLVSHYNLPRPIIVYLLNACQLVRWQVVAVFGIVTEIALFYMSIYLVQGLQLSLAKKSVVVLAFGLRLL